MYEVKPHLELLHTNMRINTTLRVGVRGNHKDVDHFRHYEISARFKSGSELLSLKRSIIDHSFILSYLIPLNLIKGYIQRH
jgi:hypothetical protein